MLSAKEEDGTEARKGSKTNQWNREGGSSKGEKRRGKLRGFSVKLVIHHYADPSCHIELQKVNIHWSYFEERTNFVPGFSHFGAVSTKLFPENQT